MDAVEATLARIAVINEDTDRRLNNLTQRIDSFVSASSRVFGNQGERLSRIEAIVETNSHLIQYLSRKADGDRAEAQAQGQRMDGMINRLDALVNYLMSNENRGSE